MRSISRLNLGRIEASIGLGQGGRREMRSISRLNLGGQKHKDRKAEVAQPGGASDS